MAEESVLETSEELVKGGVKKGGSLLSGLKRKDRLLSAATTAATALGAAYVAHKGPELVRALGGNMKEKAGEEAEELGREGAEGAKEGLGGGLTGLAGAAASKLSGGGNQAKKTRRLPIQRWTDVAVPIEVAYEQWTRFEEFPKFMHRVLHVDPQGRDRVAWDEKIWFSTRHWEGKITDRRKNDRIAWKTVGGMSHSGVVSFHCLDERLTRVMVTMEFVPQGTIEKLASGLCFVKRAVQADLARFKSYVEMDDAKGLEYGQGGGDEGEQAKRTQSEAASAQNGGASDSEAQRIAREQREKRRKDRSET